MILAFWTGLAGLLILGVVLGARDLDGRRWRRSLVAYRLLLPSDLSVDDITRWLTGLAASTHPPRYSLLPLPPVAVEITATANGIGHYLLVSKPAESGLLAVVRAQLPGARLEVAPDYLKAPVRPRLAAEAVMTSDIRPLATERAEAASTGLLATLQPVSAKCEIRYQFIMTSAGTPPRVPAPKGGGNGWAAWWEGALPRDAEAVQAARLKAREVLLRAVLRVGVSAPTAAQARALFGRVWPMLHTLNAPSVSIRRRWLWSAVVAERLGQRRYPITRWPMLLNAAEAVALVGLPTGAVRLPGLPLGTSRQLPPPSAMPRRGLVIGRSNYAGLPTRPLALATSDRLRHMFVLGPTGSGKSWLLARLILQDITAGRGVVVIDPKGDLITDVLSRVADRDAERVVVIDASRRELPIPLNVLACTNNEEARELTVDGVLHVFKEIWAPFWGPRSDQIMRAGLTTLVHSRAPDGSALTLCELLPLLTQPAFRRFLLSQPGLPESVRTFWRLFGSWSEAGAAQAINPLANKLDALTSRVPIQLMLGQSQGFDFGSVFRQRRVVLVSLAKGTLGAETASLLGALIVSNLWQATQRQIRIPAEKRPAVFAYIDEAADIMRLPLDMAELLAQARGLGLGLVAATQLIAQVPDRVKAAFLGTVRTQICFAVEHDDAAILAKRFAPLSAEELTNLGPYEIAMRPCIGGVTLAPVTGTTVPLDTPLRQADDLAMASRQRYGHSRAEIEAALAARTRVEFITNRSGRPTIGGTR
jgi:hypothetical protein